LLTGVHDSVELFLQFSSHAVESTFRDVAVAVAVADGSARVGSASNIVRGVARAWQLLVIFPSTGSEIFFAVGSRRVIAAVCGDVTVFVNSRG